ncbi:c-type cytochrome [Chitinilyticum piscinae]|uniref:Cytochrome c4 n=1 Tax=Chitinilyticum piscinae TaxID=2866724 RepID=A0A8J7K7G5_9NEIS|nr:c-type cytochrome [Chitinilyticum piscinae]MBE9608023.1 cytochrome c4 [Chitinilyticum piscinae]
MRRVSAAITIAALFLSIPFASAASKGNPQEGKKIVDNVCAACHGADGNSVIPANPSLAGQHPEYIVKQLQEFKAGKRKNGQAAVMLGMATPLSDADMQNVAAYFAEQTSKERGSSNKDLVAAGKKIYRGGIASKNVPACMACHGPSGAGIPGQYPRLSSQHASYVADQMKAFRTGERGNNQVMTDVAAKMSDAEIKAVAEYIQSLHK